MVYRFLENVSIADVAFEAKASTLNGLFQECGYALINTIIKDLKDIHPKIKKSFTISANSIEKLLFDFLNELIYLKDTERILFVNFNIDVEKTGESFSAVCHASGETIDQEKHRLVVDVKAVTMHMFKVEQVDRQWKATVVLDI